MNIDTSLAPKFAIFHYFIKWYIQCFGSIPYFFGIVGTIGVLCVYAMYKNIRLKEWDRAFMIGILAFTIMGGLIGLGMDIINGHALDPLLDK